MLDMIPAVLLWRRSLDRRRFTPLFAMATLMVALWPAATSLGLPAWLGDGMAILGVALALGACAGRLKDLALPCWYALIGLLVAILWAVVAAVTLAAATALTALTPGSPAYPLALAVVFLPMLVTGLLLACCKGARPSPCGPAPRPRRA